jgi:inositol oxygenase
MGSTTNGPLQSLDQWDDDVRARYDANKKKEEFRVYDDKTPQVVRDFYKLNHENQTLDFARAKKQEYGGLGKTRMGIWEAMEKLDALVDDSDPDTDLSQIDHNLQTAEAMRADGQPRWMILTGFIHDLGKVLTLYGEPQWAVVGDTFPVGCRWSEKIVYPEFFQENPDSSDMRLMTRYGVYEEQIGLDKIHMSWGHDEYLYHVTREYLPEEAQYMIRYHSWYSAHREMDYQYLMSDHDLKMMGEVRRFNPYDLYSKSAAKPDRKALEPYYRELIGEFFPAELRW